jgi:excisionase family DNA binding protein
MTIEDRHMHEHPGLEPPKPELRDRNTVTDVARWWGVSPRTVRARIYDGTLGHLRVGRVIRIRREDVEAYEASAYHAADASARPPRVRAL